MTKKNCSLVRQITLLVLSYLLTLMFSGIAFANLRFKCDVPKGSEILILKDNNHLNPDRKKIAEFVSETQRNGGLMVLEGLYFNNPAININIIRQYSGLSDIIEPIRESILGMEDSVIYDTVVASLNIYTSKFINPPESSRDNLRSLLITYGGSDIGRLTWQDFKKSKSYSQREIDRELDFLATLQTFGASFMKQVDTILENKKFSSELLSLKYLLSMQMVTSIQKRYPLLFSESELETLWYLPQIVRISSSDSNAVKEITNRLVVLNRSARELRISQNLADLYCTSLADGKKLYVRIGGGHFAGIKRDLEAASLRRLKVRAFE
jgi:hypothetical protein